MAMTLSERATPALSSAGVIRAQSATFIGDAPHHPAATGLVSHNATTRSDSKNGSGRSTMLSATAKMTVVAPTASAMVATTGAVKAGALRNVRTPKRMSANTVVIMASPVN